MLSDPLIAFLSRDDFPLIIFYRAVHLSPITTSVIPSPILLLVLFPSPIPFNDALLCSRWLRFVLLGHHLLLVLAVASGCLAAEQYDCIGQTPPPSAGPRAAS